MKKTKQQKIELVEKLSTALKAAASIVFVGFSGLNVADETAMRRALKKLEVRYTVVKKTLLRRVLESLGHKSEEVPMEGEVAIAYGGGADATAPARLMYEYGKKFLGPHKESKLSILGGVFEGILMGKASMQEIAMIPPAETLRGMFANVINSPIQRFAIALSEVAKVNAQ